MTAERLELCPVHGVVGRPGWEWPCPMALESEPDGESCEFFEAELERRMGEHAAGNYWSWEKDADGGRISREFKDHKPTGVVQKWPRTDR